MGDAVTVLLPLAMQGTSVLLARESGDGGWAGLVSQCWFPSALPFVPRRLEAEGTRGLWVLGDPDVLQHPAVTQG